MLISRNKSPLLDALVVLADTVVGERVPSDGDVLVRVAVLLMPDGRIYYGNGSPAFITTAIEHWQKSLTMAQVARYSIPQIQPAVAITTMYEYDYFQVQSHFEESTR